MHKVDIQTSQNVSISYSTASLIERIYAYLLDLLFMIIYSVIAFSLLNEADHAITEQVNVDIQAFYYLAITPLLFYHFLFEYFNNGQSPGKMIRKIKVAQIDGSRPGIGSFAIRWIIGLFELAVFSGAPAVLSIMFSDKGQRIGDLAANTTVLKIQPFQLGKDASDYAFTDDYSMRFPKVRLLNDNQVSLINTVLNQRRNRIRNQQIVQLEKQVRNALDLVDSTGLQPKEFLQQVVKDYTYLYWKEENKGQYGDLQNHRSRFREDSF